MKRIKKILNNSKLVVLADQAVFIGSSFAITLFIARILIPEDFGVFTSIVLFNYLLVSISTSIIIQPFQVIIAKIENRPSYLSFSFFAQASIILLMSISTFALLQFQVDFIQGLNRYAPGIFLYTSGFLFHDFHRKLFLARGSVLQALIIDSAAGILQISACTVLST